MTKENSQNASEFSLIDYLYDVINNTFKQGSDTTIRMERSDVILGTGDDCALLHVPATHQLAVTTDTLVLGRHFPVDTPAHAIGYKALAVNLSDLAAMGATPTWVSLALTLPDNDLPWLKGFAQGFAELAKQHRVQLVGGDTTRGDLSITITAHGFLPNGEGLRRSGAQLGDDIYVSGALGQAGYELLHESESDNRTALNYPVPRVALGQGLLPYAHAAIDVSDGLIQDLEHILIASSSVQNLLLGAQIYTQHIPVADKAKQKDAEEGLSLALSAGDEYELCFTASASDRAAIEALSNEHLSVTRIGHVVEHIAAVDEDDAPKRVQLVDQTRSLRSNYPMGFQHF